MAVLVADVGGTHTRLARVEGGVMGTPWVAPSARVVDMATTLRAFVADAGPVAAACLAVAGPVFGQQVRLTNLGWSLDGADLAAALGVPVRLINDFHAQALAMPHLGPGDVEALDALTPALDRPIAVLGAGTGLGEAFVVPHRGQWIAVPGEGAHTRFAPRDAREIALLGFLMQRHPGHVSVERVVSGPGLVSVYDFLRGEAPPLAAMATEDPAAVITREALAGGDARCVEAVEIFVGVLGDEAASLALKVNAGVVYLTGGIPPRIAPLIRSGIRRAFETKGRYAAWAKTVPIRLVQHPDPGLLGARVMAESLGQAG
ncbi:MAG: glucokinase [Myxococcales bacterium]|nr:glucokinase [Myxococcales bacterium]